MPQVKANEDLKDKTSWRAGGRADYFSQPSSKEELQKALLWAREKKLPITALGAGANVLISGQGVEGLVISTAKLCALDFKTEHGLLKIHALSGVWNLRLAAIFRRMRLAPALFLSGLPGTVGGGAIMNAGVLGLERPSEYSHIIRSLSAMDFSGRLHHYSYKNISWGYRQGFSEKGIIYSAEMEWPLKPLEGFREKLQALMEKRRASQPLNHHSAGSVFKNPRGMAAGRLIEEAGLKGLRRGKALISLKHGNFIINKGGASPEDIRSLIEEAKEKVRQKRGVSLQEEVRFIGRWGKTKGQPKEGK